MTERMRVCKCRVRLRRGAPRKVLHLRNFVGTVHDEKIFIVHARHKIPQMRYFARDTNKVLRKSGAEELLALCTVLVFALGGLFQRA